MYKIEKITVNNFKNIVNTELELGDMNVIVGPNNSGKSNFLQVIPFLRFIINYDVTRINEEFNGYGRIWREYAPKEPFAILGSRDDFNLEIKIDFINDANNHSYSYFLNLHFYTNPVDFSLSDKRKEFEKLPSFPLHNIKFSKERLFFKDRSKRGPTVRVFERNNNTVTFGHGLQKEITSETALPSHISVLRYLNLLSYSKNEKADFKTALDGVNEILQSPIFYFSVSELKKKINENPLVIQNERIIWTDVTSKMFEIYLYKGKGKIIDEIFKKIFNIDEVMLVFPPIDKKAKSNIERKEYTLLFRIKNEVKSITDFSDGTILLISLITEILSNNNDIIFVEEPENSIHPRALEELIRFMQEFEGKKQFIITTHSSTLLNIIKDPGNIIIAEVNEKGESTLRKPKDLKALRKKLSKGFLSLGDLLYFNIDQEPVEKENDTTIY